VYRQLIEELPVGIVVFGPDGQVSLCNRKAAELLGVALGELVGKAAWDPVWRWLGKDGLPLPPEDSPLSRVWAGRRPVLDFSAALCQPGSTAMVPVVVNTCPVVGPEGELQRIVLTMCEVPHSQRRDEGTASDEDDVESRVAQRTAVLLELAKELQGEVAGRRQAEASLLAIAHQWQATFDASPEAILVLDTCWRVQRCNHAVRNVFGVAPESLVGRHCFELVHPTAAPHDECLLHRVRASGRRETSVMQRGARWLSVIADPLLSPAGELTGVVHIVSDITELRQTEEARRAAQAELESQRVLTVLTDRLRSLGQMAAGMAHELNQPLVGVRGLAEHLLIALERGWPLPPAKLREKLALIVEQADRMSHIIEHVRLFAREAGKPECRPVQVNDVLRAVASLLSAQFRAGGIALECDLAEAPPLVSANPFSLEEVLLNLLTNARDAVLDQANTDSASRPQAVHEHAARVSAPAETTGRTSPANHETTVQSGGSMRTPPAAPQATQTQFPPDARRTTHRTIRVRTQVDKQHQPPRVMVQVIDQGTGIPEALLAQVFQPFFTTKGPDRGTGLGLAISKQIVEQFGGTLELHSTEGRGTTATVSLPAVSGGTDEQ
jgi:PAS domain S-box-containing protein